MKKTLLILWLGLKEMAIFVLLLTIMLLLLLFPTLVGAYFDNENLLWLYLLHALFFIYLEGSKKLKEER